MKHNAIAKNKLLFDCKPKVAAESLAILLNIREVSFENSTRRKTILSDVFRDFPQFHQADTRIVYWQRR
jgi:hypothetical protein